MSHETLLVPSAGEPPSERAAGHAATYAVAFDATVHAAYVLVTAGYPPTVEGTGQHLELAEERERAPAAAGEAA